MKGAEKNDEEQEELLNSFRYKQGNKAALSCIILLIYIFWKSIEPHYYY